jgi:outer membrane immunogenic protein
MRRVHFLAALIGAMATLPATAADMRRGYARPSYAPSPAYDWSGFYIGGNLGYAWSDASAGATVGGLSLDATQSLHGAAGGIQGGVNWQVGMGLVGVEADFQLTSQEKDFAYAAPGVTASGFNRLPWFGTLRGRAGIVVDQWLVYGTGGLAFTQMKTTGNATLGGTPVAINFSEPQAGWVIGGGIETALWGSNWTAKIEYLHFNSIDFTLPAAGATTRSHATNDVVRLGVNYRFGAQR